MDEIDFAHHVLEIKKWMMNQVLIASCLIIGFELFHHAILENVLELDSFSSRNIRVFVHDLTDLIGLVIFFIVLRPWKPMNYFDIVYIDTVNIVEIAAS